jgi:PAS domain S-box-containing protein
MQRDWPEADAESLNSSERLKTYASAGALRACLITLGMVAAMACLRYLLDPALGEHHPFVLFLAAVFISAWYGGWRPAVLALASGLLTADFLFIHPRGALFAGNREQQVGMLVYALVGSASILLVEALRMARRRSETHAVRLGNEIIGHQRTQQALEHANSKLERRVDLRTAQLGEATDQLRAAFEYTGIPTVLTDSEHRFVRVNEAFASMLGYSEAELIGMSMLDITHPDDATESLSRRTALLSGENRFFQVEKRYLHRDGRILWGLASVSLVRDAGGAPLLYVGQVQDVTERKWVKERLRVQHAVVRILASAPSLGAAAPGILRAVCESTDWDVGAVWVVDCERSCLCCVEIWPAADDSIAGFRGQTRQLMFAPGECLPGRAWSTRHGVWIEDLTKDSNFLRVPAATEAGMRGAFAFPLLFGEILGIAEFFSRQGRPPDEELLQLFESLGSEIGQFIARKRSEEALRESESSLRSFFQTAAAGMIEASAEGSILRANDAICRMLGYEPNELVGMNVGDLFFAEERDRSFDRFLACASGRFASYEGERRYRRKDGSALSVWVHVASVKTAAGQPGRLSAVVINLTDRKHLEEQFQQAQKMEAVGQLAGGVAHDFNNLLTIISGYSEMLLDAAASDGPERSLLEEIREAGERAAGLTRQLLAFSRKGVLEPRVVDLNETVRHAEKMLRRLIGEDVRLATALATDLGHVKVDPGQVEQVLMNLAVNARDAMPTGGRLTIETADVELDEEYAASHPEVWPGPYILMAVSDNGTGMDAATQARIFEPFFTTKETAKGTGLGLAVVHGFVKQSSGHIAVYSEPGIGTTFKIYLPAVEGLRPAGTKHSGILAVPRGAETVLLVEDEDAVRRLSCHALRGAGYTVLEAGHGGEAVRLADNYDGPIHLMVSDVVMPEMGGRILAERLTAARPSLKSLFVSGYTDDAVLRHGVLAADVAFLQKPFTPVSLALKVREVLDRQSPESESRTPAPAQPLRLK